QGKDYTLFALVDGIVKYKKFKDNKTKVEVVIKEN
ncbi:50S ribosomal protein L27, partial [bacterium]|nr:50S ribosomal protein L27 [bacterium]